MLFICLIGISFSTLTTGLPSSGFSYDTPVAEIGTDSGAEQARVTAHQKEHGKGRELNDMANICLEPGCIHAASDLLKQMNLDVDPCQDFYEFACGRFVKETFIPDEKTDLTSFNTMSDNIDQQLRKLLEEKVKDNEILPFKQTKTFYKTCMNKKNIAEQGEEPILKLMKVFGGLPAIEGKEWDDSEFSLVEIIKKFRQIGLMFDYLIDFSVTTDDKNSKRRHMAFDQPSFTIGREFLVKGRNNSNVKAYFDYMQDLVILLGSDPEIASKDISDMIDFEISLATITSPKEKRRNATLLYNLITLKDLQQKYMWLDWIGYISSILPTDVTFDENEVINIVDVPFLDNLGELLNKTPKRTIANFMLVRVAIDNVKYLTNKLRKRQQEFIKTVIGQEEEEARWKECSKNTYSSLTKALSAMYVRRYSDENAKQTALEMAQDIQREFENILKTVDWMDEKTREQAMQKLKTISTLISYPDELNQDDVLLDYHKNLKIEETSYIQNSFEIYKFISDEYYRELRKPVIKNEWKTWANAAQVTASYNRAQNNIKFAAGILQGHFFSADRPKYLNYGAIGSVIGHEITHGFDDRGSQFDAEGNLNDWWDSATREAFKEKAKCMINQYSSTLDLQTNLTLNGIITQGENIADNGGIQVGYLAYEDYVKRHGEERLLPGLKYTPKQLYWIAMSQNWCSKHKTEALKYDITVQYHPPGKYRTLIPLMNNEAFAKDFQCPKGSPMNPERKCRVW